MKPPDVVYNMNENVKPTNADSVSAAIFLRI